MLHAFHGRINRKTFLLGNMLGLSILGFIALIYIVPVAVIDLVVNASAGAGAGSVFKVLYGLYLIPVLFYAFYAAVLFVKRMHDIGYPGMFILIVFVISQVLSRIADIWLLNILAFVIVSVVCLFPGKKDRNNFGPKPHKKFRLRDLIIKF
jgi:uncharacterized membrane protein YhaH (DUF805 family)